MTRPPEELLAPRAVARWLEEAAAALAKAETAADDRLIVDAVKRARKELKPATARARVLYKDAALKTAQQGQLL